MLGLRTEKGISADKFKTLFNKDFFTEYADVLKKKEKYLIIDGDVMRIEEDYFYVQNDIILDFMK